jgi:hypothetical protein
MALQQFDITSKLFFRGQFGESVADESLLGFLMGKREGALIRGTSFGVAAQTTAKVSAGRVGEAVVRQFIVREQGIDQR